MNDGNSTPRGLVCVNCYGVTEHYQAERDALRARAEAAEAAQALHLAAHRNQEAADAYRITTLEAEVDRLRVGLENAIALAEEGWTYADEYFATKWRFDERRTRLRAILGKGRGDVCRDDLEPRTAQAKDNREDPKT